MKLKEEYTTVNQLNNYPIASKTEIYPIKSLFYRPLTFHKYFNLPLHSNLYFIIHLQFKNVLVNTLLVCCIQDLLLGTVCQWYLHKLTKMK